MAGRDLVFIGDAHLDRDDPDLPDFLAMLEALKQTARRVVLIGDLFNLWIGRREMEQPHQTAVLKKLAELRAAGISVHYVEGNRDYRIAPAYIGESLDGAGDQGIHEEQGGLRLYAIHGDLVNRDDKQYRRWRWFSRTPLFWGLFRLLPRRRSLKLAEDLETRLRRTNLAHKQVFPEEQVRSYAAEFLADHDAVILGHFHVEKVLEAQPPSPPGKIWILPLWKDDRRYLRITPEGEIGFVDS
ncbi:hypothetical protein ABI59_04960 [Acidobacteria bacterium Mor1]|nr:hypothetical protein ABI59_04960 [Acidobacteria bacterium Mor1]